MARKADIVSDRGLDLNDLEEAIEMLKVAYDRYFVGVDNMPPVRKHEATTRLLREFLRRPPMRTVQKFRFNTLKGRLNTYEQYWNRIMRQIEQGTYKRLLSESRRREDVMRARRAAERKAAKGGENASGEERAAVPRARGRTATEAVLPTVTLGAGGFAVQVDYVTGQDGAVDLTVDWALDDGESAPIPSSALSWLSK